MLTDTVGYLFERGAINGFAVLAPKGAYQIWVGDDDNEIKKHLPDRIQRRVVQWKASPGKGLLASIDQLMKPIPGTLDIFSLNIESMLSEKAAALLEQFLRTHKVLLAIDESTVIGNPAAKRTKIIFKLRDLAKARRILTGDAAPDSPLTVWSQAEFLKEGLLGRSYFAFKNTYCEMQDLHLGKRTVKVIAADDDGNPKYRNLDKLRDKISEFAFICKKKDCLDLPPKVYLERRVTMSPKQAAAYESMREMAIVDLENRFLSQPPEYVADIQHLQGEDLVGDELVELDRSKLSTAALVIVQRLRLHQIACGFIKTDAGTEVGFDDGNPRLDALMQLLGESSGSVIIWSNYRHNIFEITEAISKEYGAGSVVSYFGDTSQDDRKVAKADFQAGRKRFFVVNQATGAYALTLTKANLAIYYSNNRWREKRAQSEDRNHRIGSTGDCVTYIDLVCDGTVDESIIKDLKSKESVSRRVTPSNWRSFF